MEFLCFSAPHICSENKSAAVTAAHFDRPTVDESKKGHRSSMSHELEKTMCLSRIGDSQAQHSKSISVVWPLFSCSVSFFHMQTQQNHVGTCSLQSTRRYWLSLLFPDHFSWWNFHPAGEAGPRQLEHVVMSLVVAAFLLLVESHIIYPPTHMPIFLLLW